MTVGDSFTLSLRIDGLTGAAADSLAGFDLKLAFAAGAVPPRSRPPRSLSARPVEVRGQGLKVRGADGSEAWFTTNAPVGSEVLNKRVRGQTKPVGDSQMLDAPKFD